MEHWQIVLLVSGGFIGFVGFILKMTALQNKSNTDLLQELKMAVDKINEKIVGVVACTARHAEDDRRFDIIEDTQKHHREVFEMHVRALYEETTKHLLDNNKTMNQIKEKLDRRINEAKLTQESLATALAVRTATVDGKITLLAESIKELGRKIDNNKA